MHNNEPKIFNKHVFLYYFIFFVDNYSHLLVVVVLMSQFDGTKQSGATTPMSSIVLILTEKWTNYLSK